MSSSSSPPHSASLKTGINSHLNQTQVQQQDQAKRPTIIPSNLNRRSTPTSLGLFPNSNSQSPSSPNSLGFGKSSFQSFGRVGDTSQPSSPNLFNSPNHSSLKKPHHPINQPQQIGIQANSTNRPRKLGSFNSLAVNTASSTTDHNPNLAPKSARSGGVNHQNNHYRQQVKNHQEEDTPQQDELENQPDHPHQPSDSISKNLVQHKLRSKWVFWILHRSPSKKISEEEFGKAMRRLGSCDTVEMFYSLYLHIKRPSNHTPISDIHIFIDPIKPAWEDPMNVKGGKWTIRLRKGLANRLWETLIFSLIGGGLEKLIANGDDENLSKDDNHDHPPHREVCGAVLSIRRDEDILAVWHKTGSPEAGCDGKMAKQVKLSLQTVLQLPLNCNLSYKLNADCLSLNGGANLNTINNNFQQQQHHHQHNNHHHHHSSHHSLKTNATNNNNNNNLYQAKAEHLSGNFKSRTTTPISPNAPPLGSSATHHHSSSSNDSKPSLPSNHRPFSNSLMGSFGSSPGSLASLGAGNSKKN